MEATPFSRLHHPFMSPFHYVTGSGAAPHFGTRRETVNIMKCENIPAKNGVSRVYANNLNMAHTEYDVRLCFGEIIEVTDRILIEDRVVVTMAHHELKRLAGYLQRWVEMFEAKNGSIEAPELFDIDRVFNTATHESNDSEPQPKATEPKPN